MVEVGEEEEEGNQDLRGEVGEVGEEREMG